VNAAPPRHSPLARAAAEYWNESRRPLASLIFIAPWLVVYEVGVLALGPQAVRNGADAWLRQLLELVGFGQYFLLPLLTVCILLSWHYTTRQSWRLSGGILSGMTVECILLALCLRLLLQLQGSVLLALAGPIDCACHRADLGLNVSGTVGGLVGFLGAGIYEELLFRLMLLSGALWAMRRAGAAPMASMAFAVLLTSLLFAAAHYIPPHGESLHWFSFLFRFLAGLFFSVLFVYRGFGIAAGTHAAYDILVGLF